MKFFTKEILPCIIAVILGIVTGFFYYASMMMIVGLIFLPALPVCLALIAIFFYLIGKNRYLLAGTLYNVSTLVVMNLCSGVSGLVYIRVGDGRDPLSVFIAVVAGIIFSIPAYLLAWIIQKSAERKARLAPVDPSLPTSDPSSPSNAT